MELIRNLAHLNPRHHGCVATIGNFDGVHRGHQQVFRQLQQQADMLDLPSTVICFEPHPKELFSPDTAPARLTRLREKIQLIRNYQVQRILCLDFNHDMANLSPDEFVQQILVDRLGIRYLIVGDDFRFGKQRQGDFQTLHKLGKKYGFCVNYMETYCIRNQRVSSTRVREALHEAKFKLATKLLGRPYSMTGRVVHGNAIGRQLGYPTANIRIHRLKSPLKGIFMVKVIGVHEDGRIANGIANLGTRPVLKDRKKEMLLEVNLLDYSGDLYSKYLEVQFVHKLRDERDFPDLESLTVQMQADEAQARQLFAQKSIIQAAP